MTCRHASIRWQTLPVLLLTWHLFCGPFVLGARDVEILRTAATEVPCLLTHRHLSPPGRSSALVAEVEALVKRHPDKLMLEVVHLEREGYGASLQLVTFTKNRSTGGGGAPHPVRGLLILPLENPNGRTAVESGQLCERKNGRGVDPNRNWSVDWGKKEKDYDPKEEFPGSFPLSEPEVEVVRQVAEGLRPHLWVNTHSGMEALFMPYDHKVGRPTDGSAPLLHSLLGSINDRHLGGACVVGSGGSSVGYLAHGTATDYMFDALHIPLSFTFEIYGDNKAHTDDCFRMFNPVDAPTLEAVLSRWTSAFIALLRALPETLAQLPTRPSHEVFVPHITSAAPPPPVVISNHHRPTREVPNAHLKRRAALSSFANTRKGRTKGLSLRRLGWLVGCSGGIVVAVRLVARYWLWWRWRWQKAVQGRKPIPV